MYRKSALLSTLFLLGGVFCYNPFFPPTGDPVPGGTMRGDPESVLRQLVKSYENRRLSLFRDLFSEDGTFRFYVPQSAILELGLENLNTKATIEVMGVQPAFVDSGSTYEYIVQSDEIAIHNNLFERSEAIIFEVEPDIDSLVYADTLVRVDTLLFLECDSLQTQCDTVVVPDSVYDTVAVAMRTAEGARVAISSDVVAEVYGQETYRFSLGRQAFFLVRDPQDSTLWVIDKWFELP